MGLRNDTRVPNGGFAEVFAATKWSFGYKIELLRALDGFIEGFAAAKWRLRLRNGTRVTKEGFTVKFFAERGYGAAKLFRKEGPISQQTLDFAASPFWLRNYFAEDGRFHRGAILGCEILQAIEISYF